MAIDIKTSNLVPYLLITILVLIIVGGGYILTNLWLDAVDTAKKTENSYKAYVKENEKWKKKQEAFNIQKQKRGVWHVTKF